MSGAKAVGRPGAKRAALLPGAPLSGSRRREQGREPGGGSSHTSRERQLRGMALNQCGQQAAQYAQLPRERHLGRRDSRAFAKPVVLAQSMNAQREGTRGFRAPEVLLQFPAQGPPIDVWSAGVILLCLLTRRQSLFDASNDMHALAEICMLLGKEAVLRCGGGGGRRA